MAEKTVRINQDITKSSDEFTIISPTLADFLNEKEDYEISHGYNDKEVTLYGKADEWTIRRTKDSFEIEVVCRDKMKDAIEVYFQKTYFYSAPESDITTQMIPSPAYRTRSGDGSLSPGSIVPHEVEDYELPYASGQFMASDVATDACETAGLVCIWDAPDYPVVTPFKRTTGYSGSVIDVLKELIEPFQKTEMFRIDIYIIDTTVIIRKRRFPYVAEHTIDISDIRIQSFILTKTNYPPVRPDDSPDQTPVKDIYIVKEDYDEEVAEEDDTGEDDEDVESEDGGGGSVGGEWTSRYRKIVGPEVDEIIDPNTGKILSRIITTTELINEIVVREDMQKYVDAGMATPYLILAEESTTVFNYYDLKDFGFGYVSDYQKLLSKEVVTRIYQKKSESYDVYLKKYTHTETSYVYNDYDEVIIEQNYTVTSEYNEAGQVLLDGDGNTLYTVTLEIITYTQVNKDFIKVRITEYINGVASPVREQTISGQLPGPKKVGVNRNSTLDDDRVTEHFQEKYEVTQEGDSEEDQEKREKGEDAEIQEDLLSEDQLREIAQEIITEQRSRKYELSMTVLPLPWLIKGTVINITGTISDGLGNTFDLSTLNFLLTYFEYDRRKNEYTGTIRGIAYVTS